MGALLGLDGIWNCGSGGGASLSVSFTADNTNPAPDQLVTFTATGNVGVGYIHVWDFGDGSAYDIVEDSATTTHTYTTEETVTVRLWVIQDTAGYPYGFLVRTDYITVEATYSPIIDQMSVSPTYAFSVYLPQSGMTSGARLREDGGDTESDFGYTATGLIDTSSIATFLSGNNGYLVTGYNGLDNGNDATESTAASQLLYNSSGTLGYPCFNTSSTNTSTYPLDSAITNSGPFHGFFLMRLTGNTGADIVLAIDNSNDAWGYVRYRPTVLGSTFLGMAQGAGSALYDYGSVQPTGTYLVEVRRDVSNNVEVSLNNGTQHSAGTFTNTNSINQLIGTISAGNTFELYEIYIWNSELSTDDRNLYITHINTDYGLSL